MAAYLKNNLCKNIASSEEQHSQTWVSPALSDRFYVILESTWLREMCK